MCNSSINNIYDPSEAFTSSKTPFNLSSNSPLYFAPASNAPKSNANILTLYKDYGTSPFNTLIANPSTICVLPTPAGPVKTGLFLVLRERISVILLIS